MDDANWFARWEEELPSPEELMPLSQTLITHDLAVAFDIGNSSSPHHYSNGSTRYQSIEQLQIAPPPPPPPPHVQQNLNSNAVSSQPNLSVEFESSGGGGGGGGEGSGGDEQARTLKRPRLVWTPQLHKRFVDAVGHLGIKNAVPKTIMQLMSVDGLTRENVASHLQKYRLYLKRMQGMNNSGNGNGNNSPSGVDLATDHLFASSPVPPHFLRPNSDQFMPCVSVPVTAMQHHHPQMAVPVMGHGQQHHQFRHFGNSPPSGQLDNPFLGRQRIGTQVHNRAYSVMPSSHVADTDSPTPNGRKVLTLFPTGEDCN
ncbi:hypothetical protein Leryth_007368 [Lithospermum erythrorhizon]|nr:hypothetical protein Leryth_007368 [Lithospermum erythrorhizon]